MSESQKPIFQVSGFTDPVAIRVTGKANYLNCGSLRDFIDAMLLKGYKRFALDLKNCTGMDSTFMGILAGLAIKLNEQSPSGTVLLCNLNEHNDQLIHNLGLNKLLTLDSELCKNCEPDQPFTQLDNSEISDAEKMLEAHENLIKANKENSAEFEDVIAFLRNQINH